MNPEYPNLAWPDGEHITAVTVCRNCHRKLIKRRYQPRWTHDDGLVICFTLHAERKAGTRTNAESTALPPAYG